MASAETTPSIEKRIRGERIDAALINGCSGSTQDAAETIAFGQQKNAKWIVVDGYKFDIAYQRKLKAAGLRVLVISDDAAESQHVADVVVNQNAFASKDLYRKREPYTRLLLGTHYAMLRREFRKWQGWHRGIPKVASRILVTMGGSDPDNFTMQALKALALTNDQSLEVVVVAGGSNVNTVSLEEAAANAPFSARVVRDVENMSELIAWADLAISGSGSTCWEMCCLGLPMLLVDLAENQRPVAQQLDKQRVAIYVGSSRDCSVDQLAKHVARLAKAFDTRKSMSKKGRELVDGCGARRVCDAMMMQFKLRRATEGDCRLLWEWANEPGVRASAFSQQAIGWEEHVAWFTSRMADPTCTIFIAEDEHGSPLGQVRFNVKPNGTAEIDVSVASEFRGMGYGSRLIQCAIDQYFASGHRVSGLRALIRGENGASARAFEKAGFERMANIEIHGTSAVQYCLTAKALASEGGHR
jgi:UDP-2,4-diacetamido-2,4,6-trideoxy-beta-L-altropyranose hydrolase